MILTIMMSFLTLASITAAADDLTKTSNGNDNLAIAPCVTVEGEKYCRPQVSELTLLDLTSMVQIRQQILKINDHVRALSHELSEVKSTLMTTQSELAATTNELKATTFLLDTLSTGIEYSDAQFNIGSMYFEGTCFYVHDKLMFNCIVYFRL